MIRRGEIYFVDLDPVRGREQSGRRPVLVISSDKINSKPLVVSVVVGTKGENIPRDYSTNVRLSPAQTGLPIETVFLCFQIRAIDHNRFPGTPAGKVSNGILSKIEDAVRRCLEL